MRAHNLRNPLRLYAHAPTACATGRLPAPDILPTPDPASLSAERLLPRSIPSLAPHRIPPLKRNFAIPQLTARGPS